MNDLKDRATAEIIHKSESLEMKQGEFLKKEFQNLVNKIEEKHGVFYTHLERYILQNSVPS